VQNCSPIAALTRNGLVFGGRARKFRGQPFDLNFGSQDFTHGVDIANNQLGQLVQAMAAFGGGSGAADSLNAAPLSADTSQQTFLTTPQHA
jgi:hypothetical protein